MGGRRVVPLTQSSIIADLMRSKRRVGAALSAVQMPTPYRQDFTVAATPATDYTLDFLPIEDSVILTLNKFDELEGVDFTIDYATGVVTMADTLLQNDVINVHYWTTGELIAQTLPADTGTLLSDDFSGASGTLNGVSPDIGNAWSVIDGGISLNGSGAVHPTSFGPKDNGAYAAAVSDCGVADVVITGVIGGWGAGTNSRICLVFRGISVDEWMALEIPNYPGGDTSSTTTLIRNTYTTGVYGDWSTGNFGVVPWANGDTVTLTVVGTVADLSRNGSSVGSVDFTDFLNGVNDSHGKPGFATGTLHGVGFHANISHDTDATWASIEVDSA
jgi:hypothetical protein